MAEPGIVRVKFLHLVLEASIDMSIDDNHVDYDDDDDDDDMTMMIFK